MIGASPSKMTISSKKAPDKTATSDFMNRFKGKMTTISKDGVVGMINQTSQPVNKAEAVDFVGFKSGMSNMSHAAITPNYIPT